MDWDEPDWDEPAKIPALPCHWCGHFAHLHIGHTRMGKAEQFRMLEGNVLADLGDVLVKLRGEATNKKAAEVARRPAEPDQGA